MFYAIADKDPATKIELNAPSRKGALTWATKKLGKNNSLIQLFWFDKESQTEPVLIAERGFMGKSKREFGFIRKVARSAWRQYFYRESNDTWYKEVNLKAI